MYDESATCGALQGPLPSCGFCVVRGTGLADFACSSSVWSRRAGAGSEFPSLLARPILLCLAPLARMSPRTKHAFSLFLAGCLLTPDASGALRKHHHAAAQSAGSRPVAEAQELRCKTATDAPAPVAAPAALGSADAGTSLASPSIPFRSVIDPRRPGSGSGLSTSSNDAPADLPSKHGHDSHMPHMLCEFLSSSLFACAPSLTAPSPPPFFLSSWVCLGPPVRTGYSFLGEPVRRRRVLPHHQSQLIGWRLGIPLVVVTLAASLFHMQSGTIQRLQLPRP